MLVILGWLSCTHCAASNVALSYFMLLIIYTHTHTHTHMYKGPPSASSSYPSSSSSSSCSYSPSCSRTHPPARCMAFFWLLVVTHMYTWSGRIIRVFVLSPFSRSRSFHFSLASVASFLSSSVPTLSYGPSPLMLLLLLLLPAPLPIFRSSLLSLHRCCSFASSTCIHFPLSLSAYQPPPPSLTPSLHPLLHPFKDDLHGPLILLQHPQHLLQLPLHLLLLPPRLR